VSRRKPTLDVVYSAVPEVRCRGLCADQCTTLAVAPAELARIAKAGGRIHAVGDMDPSLLGAACPSLRDGRCGIYRDRPLICRLYGAAQGLECPHGCQPAGGHLPVDAVRWLIRQTHRV
jgi:uncharacterized protein